MGDEDVAIGDEDVGMTVVVGLGNPGRWYRRTRHNIGFRVVDEIARRHRVRLKRSSGTAARIGRLDCGRCPVLLVEPQTYMNRSGLAVRAVLAESGRGAEDLVVVVDDVHLPLGRLRLRRGGSDGGHNGLQSIIQEVGSSEFARVRVGVGGSSLSELTNHVLGTFERSERALARRVVAVAADAVVAVIGEGLEPAMNRFNGLDLVTNRPRESVEESI